MLRNDCHPDRPAHHVGGCGMFEQRLSPVHQEPDQDLAFLGMTLPTSDASRPSSQATGLMCSSIGCVSDQETQLSLCRGNRSLDGGHVSSDISDERMTVAALRRENVCWLEEKEKWIRAAGVSSPAELEVKLEHMSKAGERTEAEIKNLTCHVVEVKELLLGLQKLDKKISKRRRRRSTRTISRKRASGEVWIDDSKSARGSCSFSASNILGVSGNEHTEQQWVSSLLDPGIMNSFHCLITPSATQRQQPIK